MTTTIVSDTVDRRTIVQHVDDTDLAQIESRVRQLLQDRSTKTITIIRDSVFGRTAHGAASQFDGQNYQSQNER